MALFQTSVLKSHLALIDQPAVDKAYKKYQSYFLDVTIQEEIKKAKEEQYQATFLQELFVNVLGYTLFPNPAANLITEFKNETNSRKADGAILKDGKAIGVIELKGTNTKDLESIRRQAFDYKANQKECVYVITSNFEKLRFYINDATEFEEFDLFTLSRKRFNLLYLCLHLDKVLQDKPLKIKEASIAEEEEITKAFYRDYSVFKRELYRDLVKRNSKTVKSKIAAGVVVDESEDDDDVARLEKNVKLTLFKKSQKLIDRFLFIFFAEDRMLLPANSTVQILEDWNKLKNLDVHVPVYDRFKLYFSYLDQGRKGSDGKAEIYAYNGGLFKPDTILDALEIDDELLYKHTFQLANYDFESQVDVNILGHIFENSLNEIESVNAQIEGGEFDKQTSKRKKDGVFYTPKYITKYIVENTVGKLCEEKKTELGFNEEEYFKGRKNRPEKVIKRLMGILDNYREWLLQITICDPACGSGAFLNQALDFLIKEHAYIDELKTKILGGGLQFPDIENTILENNIYGVDLNEESVEIAKLSLWLRTAQPRRKLNDLSSNIKCGNSLIDSKSVAGDKAFKWEEEFPDVFADGGFDVVIGNPPYVSARQMNIKHRDYLSNKFTLLHGAWDLYVPFLLLGIDISKSNIYGWIIPNKLLISDYSENSLTYLKEEGLGKVINISSLPIFKNVGVYPIIILGDKERSSFEEYEIFDIDHLDSIENYVKVGNQFNRFETFVERGIKMNSGTTGFEARKIKPLIHEGEQGIDFAVSGSIDPYSIDRSRVPYMKSVYSYPKIVLDTNLLADSKIEFWNQQKVVIAGMTKRVEAYYTKEPLALGVGIYGIYDFNDYLPRFILGILNSKFLTYYLNVEFYDKHLAGGYLAINKSTIEQLPLIEANIDDQEYVSVRTVKYELHLGLFKDKVNKMVSYIYNTLKVQRLSRKLQSWHELSFADFIKELTKAIKKENRMRKKVAGDGDYDEIPLLTKSDEFEWMELFESKKKEAQELQSKITATENEIDQIVYELYGLSEEEIEIVEKS
jgi:type I restriction-modification system DNA methylase subunit